MPALSELRLCGLVLVSSSTIASNDLFISACTSRVRSIRYFSSATTSPLVARLRTSVYLRFSPTASAADDIFLMFDTMTPGCCMYQSNGQYLKLNFNFYIEHNQINRHI